MMAISASVLNRASSKIKTVRPSVELKDRVILLNYILNSIEQKVPVWLVAKAIINKENYFEFNNKKDARDEYSLSSNSILLIWF
jgi:hypothetical protein